MNILDWEPHMAEADAQLAYTKFQNTFLENVNICFPLKRLPSQYKARIPWMTDGIRTAIKNKHKLYVKSLKYRTPKSIEVYKKHKNKLNHILRIMERDYYQSQIALHKNNLKKSWAVIKDVINRKKITHKPNIQLKINDKIINDPYLLAEQFNNFVINIGPNLDKKIPP
jgi:hypothetical protein